jgi:DMSO/TMAO reductase YedYZ molybdopterin-dependent catalytic subunit
MTRRIPAADPSTTSARARSGAPARWAKAWPSAVAGALAAGVAIAVAELLAGLVAGAPSLVIAIGSLVIRLQPPGAKDLFAGLFGSNDKLALNAIIVIAALLIAAGAGILAARRFRDSALVFVAFGLVATFAAIREPLVAAPLAVVSGVLALVAGLVALRWLGSLAAGLARSPVVRAGLGPTSSASVPGGLEAAGSTTETALAATLRDTPAWSRRRFLIASAGTLGGVIVAGGAGRILADARPAQGVLSTSRLPKSLEAVAPLAADQSLAVDGITPLVIPSDRFYRTDTSLLVPQVGVETWRLNVKGMVGTPLTFTYDELLAMPLFEQYVTIACVSNQVGGDLVGNALWTGVRLKDVLARAGVQPGATQIVGRSEDDFTVGFPTAWAMAPEREPMIAVGMNREPLPAEHGFPARLMVSGLFGYVSATKWLSSIELTTLEAVDGYWIPLGWAKEGPILTQSRIDVPTSDAHLAAGSVEVAGVAWAPDRGIATVEVRIDDGAWQPARISRPISKAAWVQWALDWPAAAGRHSLEVRATDETGDVQTDRVTDPAPDGARGHHRIIVNVG